MTDASYAASLASIQTDMASLLSGTIATIQEDNAKERRAYEERETNRENQRQEQETARETQQNKEKSNDLKRLAKVEERNKATQNVLMQLVQQMSQQNNYIQQQSSRVLPFVPPAAGIQQQEPPPYTTTTMLEAVNDIQLTGKLHLAKKHKQHDVMDHLEDHPQLTGRLQSTDSTNQLQPPPEGSQH